MHAHPLISRVSHSVAFGGKCAFIFAPIFFVFLFATILMVGGDGSAPQVTHLSAAILGFSVKLLGVSFEGSIVPVVLFWSLAVFVVAFLYALLSYKASALPAQHLAGRRGSYWTFGIIAVVVAVVVLLIRNNQNEAASIREKALALEFVRNNTEIMREVGGGGRVDLVAYTKASNKPAIYDIGVHGTKTLYAIVEASRGSPMPTFKLVCTTPLYVGQRDPFKSPCQQ